jgi:hypothetical protein
VLELHVIVAPADVLRCVRLGAVVVVGATLLALTLGAATLSRFSD